jgi:putative membrane protein
VTPRTALFALVGVFVLSVALLNCDLAGVGHALGLIGWGGAVLLSLWRMIPIALCVLAQRALIPTQIDRRIVASLAARLGRDGVSALLPILPAGGEIVGARILSLYGVTGGMALAILVVDLTLEIASQAGFSILGVGALFVALPKVGAGQWGMLAVLLPVIMVLGLAFMQHPKVIEKLEDITKALAGDRIPVGKLIPHITSIYQNKRNVAICYLLHLGGWVIGIGEAWLALNWLGHPLPILSVLALEAVVFAIKGVAFIIPWSIGVQEGGYMALGAALGVPAELALSLALIKRLPDIVLGIPGLMLWHRAEKKIPQDEI